MKTLTTLALALVAASLAQAQVTKTLTPLNAGHYTIASTHGGSMMVAAAAESDPLPKDDIFAGTEIFAKGASDVTEITMDPEALDMVSGSNKRTAHTMVLNIVRTYSYDKPGMYNMADVDTYRNKLSTGDWHCSVHIRDLKNGESTDVCNKHRNDGMVEQAVVTVEPKSLTFIHTIRKAGDGKSGLDGLPALSSLGNMPALAMVTDANIAALQAKLQVLSAMDTPVMQAVLPSVMGAGVPELDRKIRVMIPNDGNPPPNFLLDLEKDPTNADGHVGPNGELIVKKLRIMPEPGTSVPYDPAPAPQTTPIPEAPQP